MRSGNKATPTNSACHVPDFSFSATPSTRTFATNISWAFDQTTWNQEGGSGRAGLLDAYVSSWHIPWLTIQAGQQRVWFNRATISSMATSTLPTT